MHCFLTRQVSIKEFWYNIYNLYTKYAIPNELLQKNKDLNYVNENDNINTS